MSEPKGRWDTPTPSESMAEMIRPTAGSSVPESCVHDFFAIGGGKFKCKWCHAMADYGGEGEE